MKVVKSYAMYSCNENMRRNSSSGGVFFELANYVVNNGGVIYGVVMSKDSKHAEYRRVDAPEDLVKLLGSKYIQARVGETFARIKKDLESGKEVLFSGTGCYINGLKSYLKNDYKSLLCIEVICHGVPSPKLWNYYTDYMEQKFKMKISEVNFRCKTNRWEKFSISTKRIDEKNYFCVAKNDPFLSIFLHDYCLRPSCYNCKAKDIHNGDITIGDFWGIDNVEPELNDKKGTSLVIVRTDKGLEYIELIKNNMISKEVDYREAIQYNPAEYQSVKKPSERDTFFADLDVLSFYKVLDEYIYRGTKGKIKKIVLNSPLKRFLGGGGTEMESYGLMIVFERN